MALSEGLSSAGRFVKAATLAGLTACQSADLVLDPSKTSLEDYDSAVDTGADTGDTTDTNETDTDSGTVDTAETGETGETGDTCDTAVVTEQTLTTDAAICATLLESSPYADMLYSGETIQRDSTVTPTLSTDGVLSDTFLNNTPEAEPALPVFVCVNAYYVDIEAQQGATVDQNFETDTLTLTAPFDAALLGEKRSAEAVVNIGFLKDGATTVSEENFLGWSAENPQIYTILIADRDGDAVLEHTEVFP